MKDHFTLLFKLCLLTGYVPVSWRKARVVFLSKPGKSDYTQPSAWRPISLTSFYLKMLERLVDRHLRTQTLCSKLKGLHQFAYLPGVDTEAAASRFVGYIERGMEQKLTVVAALADIEGAFNNIRVGAIEKYLEWHGIDPLLNRWISFMLRNRVLRSTLHSATIDKQVQRGVPQGGVLSPLIWNLCMHELLVNIRRAVPSLFVQAYADDLVLAQTGIDPGTVNHRLKQGLSVAAEWCRSCGLNLNPSKTEVIPFSRNKRKTVSLPILLGNCELIVTDRARYLGLLFDKALNWTDHIALKAAKATSQFALCRRVVGRSWGLGPKVMRWVYTAVIRPSIEYGAVVWAHALKTQSRTSRLVRLQRCALLAITGAMNSTATTAMESLIGLPPLDIHIQARALSTWHRLKRNNQIYWSPLQTGTRSHVHWCTEKSKEIAILLVPNHLLDHSDSSTLAASNFNVQILPRKEWESDRSLSTKGIVCFTDGSRMNNCSGCGLVIESRSNSGTQELISFSIPLGKTATVFQCELDAINSVANWLSKRKVSDEAVTIY